MKESITKKIQILFQKNKNIPEEFWHGILWLYPNRLGIERNGQFNYVDPKKGKQIGNSLPPFIKQNMNLTSSDEERIEERIDQLLILCKTKDEVTVRDILTCKNIEIRRYLFNLVGSDRIIELFNAIILDQDKDSVLFLIPQKRTGEVPMMFIKVLDATSKKPYLIRVPEKFKTCKQAIAWTFGMTAEEYNPSIET